MHIELSCNNTSVSEKELQDNIFYCINKNINLITIPQIHLPINVPIHNLKISVPIDFPYGNLSTETRINAIIQAEKKGASVVDLVINSGLIHELKFDVILNDLSKCLKVAKDRNIIIRCVIEYRNFNEDEVLELCKKLSKIGIEYIVTSTGAYFDDWLDNLILCETIQNKINIFPILATNNFIDKEKYDLIYKSNIFGMSFPSLKAISTIFGV